MCTSTKPALVGTKSVGTTIITSLTPTDKLHRGDRWVDNIQVGRTLPLVLSSSYSAEWELAVGNGVSEQAVSGRFHVTRYSSRPDKCYCGICILFFHWSRHKHFFVLTSRSSTTRVFFNHKRFSPVEARVGWNVSCQWSGSLHAYRPSIHEPPLFCKV